MYSKFFLVLSAVFVFSCKSKNRPLPLPPPVSMPGPAQIAGCYELKVMTDTAWMELKADSGSYTGTIDYRPSAKRHHSGTVTLQVDSSYLTGWYRSRDLSGKTTVMQKIFKPAGNHGFIEGTGDMVSVHDSAKYKYPHNLHFDINFPFVKKPCL